MQATTDVQVHVGSRTPWGIADNVSYPAPGIAVASTPGHGGVKLSTERNAAIPPALRNRSGWYEEDCEVAIVGMYHPDALPHYKGGDQDAIRQACTETVKSWFPDKYEQATGLTVTAAESYMRREQHARTDAATFRAAHSDQFVSTGWGTDANGSWVPKGYTVLEARIDETGVTRDFLMPHDDGIADHSRRDNVLIDLNRHIDVTGIGGIGNPEKVERPLIHDVGIDYTGMTAAQRNRAANELGKRYRFTEGDQQIVETMAEHFARVGVTGKRPIAFGNKPGVGYYVNFPESRVMQVSKAAFDALTGVPDVSDEVDRASIALRNAEAKLERVERDRNREKVLKARAEVEATRTAYTAASRAREARNVPWEERQQMRAAALAALLTNLGIVL